jgi:CHASE2 domain-containing sensor protein
MPERPIPRTRPDWRGWIALAWVLAWGCVYALMAIQARAPQVLAWFQSSTFRR